MRIEELLLFKPVGACVPGLDPHPGLALTTREELLLKQDLLLLGLWWPLLVVLCELVQLRHPLLL